MTGTRLFNAAAGKLQWLMEMDAFLRFHGLPAARRDHIVDLMKLLGLEGRQRGFLDRYLAAPTYKVMVRTPDGKHHFTQFGAGSLEAARKAALQSCARTPQGDRALPDRHGERRLARRRGGVRARQALIGFFVVIRGADEIGEPRIQMTHPYSQAGWGVDFGFVAARRPGMTAARSQNCRGRGAQSMPSDCIEGRIS